MGVFEFLAITTALGCVTAVILALVDRFGDSRRRDVLHRAELAEARATALEARLVDLHVRGSELERQLDWSRRLLEAGDAERARARELPGEGGKESGTT